MRGITQKFQSPPKNSFKKENINDISCVSISDINVSTFTKKKPSKDPLLDDNNISSSGDLCKSNKNLS